MISFLARGAVLARERLSGVGLVASFLLANGPTFADPPPPPLAIYGGQCAACYAYATPDPYLSLGQAFDFTLTQGNWPYPLGVCAVTWTYTGSALYAYHTPRFSFYEGVYVPGGITSVATPSINAVPPSATSSTLMNVHFVLTSQPLPPSVSYLSPGYGFYIVQMFGYADTDPTCPDLFVFDPGFLTHTPVGLYAKQIYVRNPNVNIQLNGLKSIEPSQSLSASALVTDSSGNPVSGVIVHLRVDAVANSGGHMHGDDADPLRRGKLSGIGPEIVGTAPTGANGAFPFAFGAPSVAGTYSITATCDNQSCAQVGVKTLDAKIEGLVALAGQSFYSLVGSTSTHPDNHYLTPDAAFQAEVIALVYKTDPRKMGKGVLLAFNDSSLVWGGSLIWNPIGYRRTLSIGGVS